MRTYWLGAAVWVLLAAPAGAQEGGNVADALSGKDHPHTRKLKELGPDWRRVGIPNPEAKGGMGDLMKSILPLAMASAGPGKGKGGPEKPDDAMATMLGMQFLSALFGGGASSEKAETVYYTRGDTVRLGTESFLVAYRLEKKAAPTLPIPGLGGGAGGGDAGKITEDSEITLSFLNLRSVNALTGIRSFDLKREVEEANAGGPGGGLLELFGGLGGALGGPDAAPPGAAPKPTPKKSTPP
ncbi:MAG: hypothetical protein FJX77_14185, partial [Armatimonadetes bacterium]|nr:hypothetical protein [Armatimonadota bacterium]